MNVDTVADFPGVERAACQGADIRLFFPGPGEPQHAAKAYCAACQVRAACLTHAIARHELWGIWGGLSTRERRLYVRRTRRNAA